MLPEMIETPKKDMILRIMAGTMGYITALILDDGISRWGRLANLNKQNYEPIHKALQRLDKRVASILKKDTTSSVVITEDSC